jgi:DNA-binding XRE family transcriptional regulator
MARRKAFGARRRALGLSQQDVAEAVGVHRSTIVRYEQGASEPRPWYRPMLAETLQVSLNQLAVLIDEPGTTAPTPRPGSAAPSPPVELLEPTVWTPECGGSDYLETVREYIQQIVALDNRFGGADLTKLCVRFFRTFYNQIGSGIYNQSVDRDLQAAAGELAELTGWVAYDADEQDLVRRMNHEALYFTRLAGDRKIELLTLQNSSMHAGHLGRPREALQIANSVLEGDYALSPRLRTLFLTRKARALAQGGDEGALRIFQEIRSLYLDGTRDDDPGWAWWVDERELDWHEAMANQDLGKSGSAVILFERSVEGISANEVRSQYVHRAHLLGSQLAVKCWSDAVATMQQIRSLASEVASTRTVVLLGLTLDGLVDRKTPREFSNEVEQLRLALSSAPK